MSPSKPIVVVLGSLNMDLVCRVTRRPAPGETVFGQHFAAIPGGKGANQAVAAAKLGAAVHLVGRVGDDEFGRQLLGGLQQHGVVTHHVSISPQTPSGVAMIVVDDSGENSIVVTPGANGLLTPADVDAAADVIRRAARVVMQLEVPFATVTHMIELCDRLGVQTILDPAPAAANLPATFFHVDLLSPNEAEGRVIAGLPAEADDEAVGRALLDRGAKAVVLKLGAAGSLVCRAGRPFERIAPFKVKAVDTTAAGDAFTAGLAVGLSEGMELIAAARFASAAGALTCTAFGAQPSLPTRAALDSLLANEPGC